MTTPRQFGIPLEELEDRDDFEGREFYDTVVIAGRSIDLYTPTSAQTALLMWSEGGVDDVRNTLNLLGHMMTREDKAHVHRAILRNALTEDEIVDLGREVFDAVSNHPTQRSSASTESPSTTGRSSTAGSRRAASAPGTSRRASSRTSSTSASSKR